jgi:hypothetical protein
VEEARVLRDILLERTEGPNPDPRQTKLMASSLRAHVALAEGDTALAIELLDTLSPNVRRGSLYRPWESLGFERLTLARLLVARGRFAEAYREATVFDSPGAANLIFPVFLPASLELRLEAARQLGDRAAAEIVQSRLSALGR